MLLNNVYQGHSNTDQWVYNLLKPLESKFKKKSPSGVHDMIWQYV